MTQAREMLDAGLTILEGQFSAVFLVDGDPAPKSGRYEGFVYGNVLTDAGVVQKRGTTLTFKPAVWTPVVGKRVTFEGLTFVVDAIDLTPNRWRVTLVESHA
jgi:hypothetical protein